MQTGTGVPPNAAPHLVRRAAEARFLGPPEWAPAAAGFGCWLAVDDQVGVQVGVSTGFGICALQLNPVCTAPTWTPTWSPNGRPAPEARGRGRPLGRAEEARLGGPAHEVPGRGRVRRDAGPGTHVHSAALWGSGGP